MHLPMLTRTAAIKAATLIAAAALLLTGCGSNNSDSSDTKGSKPATTSTKPKPELPKLEYTALTAWTVDPDDSYVERRIIDVGANNCFLETRSTSTTKGDVYPPSPMDNCLISDKW